MKRIILMVFTILFLLSGCTPSDPALPTDSNPSMEASGQTDTDFVDASSENQNPSNTTDEKKKLTSEEALQRVKDSAQDGAEVYELYDDSPQSYKDQGKFYVIRSINPAPVELVHHGLTQFLYLVHP